MVLKTNNNQEFEIKIKDFNFNFDVENIVDLADIHIPQSERHREYRMVFEDVFNTLKQPQFKNSISLILGDLVDDKLRVTVDLFDMVEYFLSTMANIMPTFVILGNHDLNLNNPEKKSIVEEVIETLWKSEFYKKNLIFLKKSGIYRINNKFDLVHFSIFDIDKGLFKFNALKRYYFETYCKSDGCEDIKKLAIGHFTVWGSRNALGIGLENEITADLFEGFDGVLLGDVHRRQIFDVYGNVIY